MTVDERLDTAARVAPSAERADEYGLVLEASRIVHRVEETAAGWAVMVAAGDAARARRALDAYDRENRVASVPGTVPSEYGRTWIGAAAAALLVGFFAVAGPRAGGGAVWFDRGSASAERILRGEVWRAVTALTLHVDAVHVFSNAVACVVLVTAVGWWVGPGIAVWLVLLAGAGGNALTALVYGSDHIAVGASTSTFGAVGILAARQFVARRRRPWSRRTAWVAVGAGLAILAMLGTGAGTDILAHFFGLLVGGAVGVAAALTLRRPPPPSIQWWLAAAAAAFVVACWWIALAAAAPR